MKRLERQYDISIWRRPFPLRRDIPPKGVLLEGIFARRGLDLKTMQNRSKEMAREHGLPMGDVKRIHNSRPAHELDAWATSLNRGDDWRDAVFHAFYAHGKNISDPQILGEIAESIGLSHKEAVERLDAGTFKQDVDLAWKRADDLGLVAAPTCLVNENRLVGAQPYEKLRLFAESNGAKRRD